MSGAKRESDLSNRLWESATATVTSIDPGSMSDALFWEHAHRHELSLRYSTSWATDAEEVELTGADELLRTEVQDMRTVLLAVGDVLVHARLLRGRATVSLAYNDSARGEEVLARLRAALPTPIAPPGVPRVSFTFSWSSDHGVSWTSRLLDVTKWADIADNYSGETRRKLDHLAKSFRPDHSGQTIVWHGEPGTGKTNALRALAYEWRDWCDVHVVTDPDRLFGTDASYLMEVIAAGPNGGPHTDRRRLIVLEDSGELLTGDARKLIGHGLSRFLNVCDGLLGQAGGPVLLVTTNEPLKRLHPAVRRPGRCSAEVEFRRLEAEEAGRWLVERNREPIASSATIAELFALVNGHAIQPLIAPSEVQIGFG